MPVSWAERAVIGRDLGPPGGALYPENYPNPQGQDAINTGIDKEHKNIHTERG